MGVDSIHHPFVVVMSADCDLYWDFQTRYPDQLDQEQYQSPLNDETHHKLLPHVLFCDVYNSDQIRGRFQASYLWQRITQNQDERYHYFKSAPIGNSTSDPLPDLCIDFKKTFALPTRHLYDSLPSKSVRRIAIVPPIYAHDLIQRFFSFLSRVALPE